MSNAIAPSTALVSASASGEANYDFTARCAAVAARKLPANGLTTGSVTMSRNKLVSALCADYRAAFAAIYSKRDAQGQLIPEALRLPEDIYNKVCGTVDAFIAEQFNKFINAPDELVKTSTRFVHKSAQKDVILRHTIQRDEIIALKERKLGIQLFIGETQRQLDKYNSQKSTWSEVIADRVQKLEKRLAKEQATLVHLEDEMAKQASATVKS